MSNGTIFVFAIVVFALMMIGILLTAREFTKLIDQESGRKGNRRP